MPVKNQPDENISVSTGIFGASVKIAAPDTGMFLVIGNAVSPVQAVSRYGGEIVMTLSTRALLAMLTFADYISLKSDRDIARVGPVTVDIERFNRTLEMLQTNLTNSR